MRPIYGCPENFTESLLLPNFLMGFCSDRSYECAYKIWSCSITISWDTVGLIGLLKNLGSPWIRPRSLFSKIFNGLLFGWALNVSAKFEFRSFTRSWDNIDCSFGLGLQTPNLEEGVWGRGWYHSKERRWVPVGPPWYLFLYLYAFQRYWRFCGAPARHFFPPHVSPKFPHVPWLGIGGRLLGHEERRCWASCPCS